jgi:3-oxoacyl-[acyl-carrier protein] reductase
MDLGLQGKTALVNGGSSGLGFASAMTLAREGTELFVSARGKDRLTAACEAIHHATGTRVTPIVADHATDEGRLQILEACPQPDIFIGTSSPQRLVTDYRTVSEDELRYAIEVGLISPFSFIQAIAEGMAVRGWGRIVNIASSAVKFPMQMRILSGGPRAALVNYTVAIAKALAGSNVTINTLLPALHLTEGTRSIFEPLAQTKGLTYEEEIARQVEALSIPAGRFGSPEDFGAIVAFFCSAHTSYVTGQSLVVDGGLASSII